MENSEQKIESINYINDQPKEHPSSLLSMAKPYWKGFVVGLLILIIDFLFSPFFRSYSASPFLYLGKNVEALSGWQIVWQTFVAFFPYFIVSPRLVSFYAANYGLGTFNYFLIYYAILPLYPLGSVFIQFVFRRRGYMVNFFKVLILLFYIAVVAYGGLQAKTRVYDQLKFSDMQDEGIKVVKLEGLTDKLEVDPKSSGYGDVQYHISYFDPNLAPESWQDEKKIGREVAEIYIIKFQNVNEMRSTANKIINENVYGNDGNTVIRKRMKPDEKYQNNIFTGSQSDLGILSEALWVHINPKGNFMFHISSDSDLTAKLIQEYNGIYPSQALN